MFFFLTTKYARSIIVGGFFVCFKNLSNHLKQWKTIWLSSAIFLNSKNPFSMVIFVLKCCVVQRPQLTNTIYDKTTHHNKNHLNYSLKVKDSRSLCHTTFTTKRRVKQTVYWSYFINTIWILNYIPWTSAFVLICILT